MYSYKLSVLFILILSFAMVSAEAQPFEKMFGKTGLIPGSYTLQITKHKEISITYKKEKTVSTFTLMHGFNKSHFRHITFAMDIPKDEEANKKDESHFFHQKDTFNSVNIIDQLVFRTGKGFSDKKYQWVEHKFFSMSNVMRISKGTSTSVDLQKDSGFMGKALVNIWSIVFVEQVIYDKSRQDEKEKSKKEMGKILKKMIKTDLP